MKIISTSFLVSLLFFSVSCIEEEYTQNKDAYQLQQKNDIMNRTIDSSTSKADSVIIYNEIPCIGWDCQKSNKSK